MAFKALVSILAWQEEKISYKPLFADGPLFNLNQQGPQTLVGKRIKMGYTRWNEPSADLFSLCLSSDLLSSNFPFIGVCPIQRVKVLRLKIFQHVDFHSKVFTRGNCNEKGNNNKLLFWRPWLNLYVENCFGLCEIDICRETIICCIIWVVMPLGWQVKWHNITWTKG